MITIPSKTVSTQLMTLRGVPDDEANDIRELLVGNEIDFYETPAGNWGLSMPAIWLTEEHQIATAKRLVQSYQAERATRVRGEYEHLKAKGENRTLFNAIKENPIRFASYLAIATLVLFFSIKPFVDMVG